MPTVHLVCGAVGAGKTTYARRLARASNVVRFSLDEWIMGLFGAEAPHPMQIEWWTDRAGRCWVRIWEQCERLLLLGSDIVLDCGFPTRAHRDECRVQVERAGAKVVLHFVVVDPALRFERVRQRNQERGETFALPVTDDMFRGSEDWWQPPGPDELHGVEVTWIGAEG